MLAEVQELMQSYVTWLQDQSTLREIDGWVEITTPYLDRHNDCLQIYARPENGGFLLTDDAYTITDLETSGSPLDTSKRKALLQLTLNGFGVQLSRDRPALQIHASPDNFPLRKHSLIQAMLAVNDLFYLAQPTVASLFYEDVVAWLAEAEVRYLPTVSFTGTSGYLHRFDFGIPKSNKQPERILKAINFPSRNTTESLIHAWSDTRTSRPTDARAYALLNDGFHKIPSGVPEALNSYGITPVPWKQRETVREELAT
jgi:hypothetical protein